MTSVVTYDVLLCTLEQSEPKYFWGKSAWICYFHTVQHSSVWRCLLQFQKLLSCWRRIMIKLTTSLLSKANSLRLAGISALCSTVHHRHFSSLSKLHFMIDYHNLELRLHSLKITTAVSGDSQKSNSDICSAAGVLLSTNQDFCNSKTRCSHLENRTKNHPGKKNLWCHFHLQLLWRCRIFPMFFI